MPFSRKQLRILIIEDQLDFAESLWDFLEGRGHRVDHAVDGVQGLRMASESEFDVVILDLGLPRMDGLDVCAHLRAQGKSAPILMLTARDAIADRLVGFAQGADDYLVKPCSMLELEVRLRNLVRRSRGHGLLRLADLEFDSETRVATRAGLAVKLTSRQSQLLEALLRASPAVVESTRLEEAVWGDESPGADALHSLVRSLRQSIDRPFDQALIRTVHGIGYQMQAGNPCD
jgi:DNA-binding response OmpR family regulator